MKINSILLVLSLVITTISVAQTKPMTQTAGSPQIETLAQQSGGRSDGGANFVWDPVKKKMVLLDLYLWDRITEIDPMDYVMKSPRLARLKELGEANFYRFYFDLLTKRKAWFLVRDINLEQYPQCVNSIKLVVKKKIAACQTEKFIFIDANMFSDADGLSQDGTILHELGVGYGQLLGWYKTEASKEEIEFRIQRFVGAGVHEKHTVESLKDFMSNVLRTEYYTKAELDVFATVFENSRRGLCDAFSKLTHKDMNRESYASVHKELETLNTRFDPEQILFEKAQFNLSFFRHPKYGSVSEIEFYPSSLKYLFTGASNAVLNHRLNLLCKN